MIPIHAKPRWMRRSDRALLHRLLVGLPSLIGSGNNMADSRKRKRFAGGSGEVDAEMRTQYLGKEVCVSQGEKERDDNHVRHPERIKHLSIFYCFAVKMWQLL